MKHIPGVARLAAIAALSFCAVPLGAQTNVGTTIGQFLLIEPSARAAGMGNAGVTMFDEAQSAYFNPAALGRLTRVETQFTHSSWLAGIQYNYAVVAVPLSLQSAVSFTMTSLSSGDIAVRTVSQPLGTGENYQVTDIAYGVGYGQRITDRVSAGIQVTWMQETIWHSSISAFALNLGTIFQISEDGLVIGASLSNFGTRAQYDGRDLRVRYDFNSTIYGDNSSLPAQLYTDAFGLPILFRVGISYPWVLAQDHRVVFVADAFHPSDNTESVSVGAEYTFADLVAFRAGYQSVGKTDSEVGLTLGGGIRYEMFGSDFKLDYAWNDYGRLSNVQRLTIGLIF